MTLGDPTYKMIKDDQDVIISVVPILCRHHLVSCLSAFGVHSLFQHCRLGQIDQWLCLPKVLMEKTYVSLLEQGRVVILCSLATGSSAAVCQRGLGTKVTQQFVALAWHIL